MARQSAAPGRTALTGLWRCGKTLVASGADRRRNKFAWFQFRFCTSRRRSVTPLGLRRPDVTDRAGTTGIQRMVRLADFSLPRATRRGCRLARREWRLRIADTVCARAANPDAGPWRCAASSRASTILLPPQTGRDNQGASPARRFAFLLLRTACAHTLQIGRFRTSSSRTSGRADSRCIGSTHARSNTL